MRPRPKNIALSLDVEPGTPERLLGDELRLTEVLVNFVNNAIKFTDQGSVHMAVALQEQTRAGAAQVSVQDTGIGIAPEQMDLLFKEFFANRFVHLAPIRWNGSPWPLPRP